MSARPRIAVVGGMNIDIQGKTFLPFRSGDSNPGSLSLVPGGVGRNIAENLARLGAEVELITVLGDDQYAPLLEASCRAVGVGLENAIRLENCPSSCYLCILDANGSLAGGLSSMDSIDRLLPDRLEQRAKLLDSVELIIVDANVPVATINWLASRYPKGTTRPLLGFDPVSEKKAERGRAALGSFAFAKPNRAEAAVLADYIGQRCGEPVDLSPDALASVLCQKGLDSAFISLGFEGLWAQGPKRERWVARLPKKRLSDGASKSCSGAGDAACAAIAWGLLQGQSLGERCSLALAAGMLTAASLTPVNPEMREDRLIEIAKGIECERIS